MMSVGSLLTTSALLLQLLPAADSEIDPSICRAIWIFKIPCSEPFNAVVSQVKTWSTKKCDDSQEKCMYEILKESPTDLEIRHTSRSTRIITAINFEFTPPAAPAFCRMKIVSTTKSKNATDPNDYSQIYNLISGSGMTQAPGHREICKEAMCPTKQSQTCNK